MEDTILIYVHSTECASANLSKLSNIRHMINLIFASFKHQHANMTSQTPTTVHHAVSALQDISNLETIVRSGQQL